MRAWAATSSSPITTSRRDSRSRSFTTGWCAAPRLPRSRSPRCRAWSNTMHAFEFDTRKFSPEHPPVVLLGVLNVLRALGRAGIPVIVAASCADELALVSRYCRGRLRLPPLDDPRPVVDVLLQAGKRLADHLG